MQRTVDRWIEALLSGRYQQGHSKFVTHEGGVRRHCVMGVLVSLDFQLQKAIESVLSDGMTWESAGKLYPGCGERLMQLGVEWLIDERYRTPAGRNPMEVLIQNNDEGMSFKDLVECIRDMDYRYPRDLKRERERETEAA